MQKFLACVFLCLLTKGEAREAVKYEENGIHISPTGLKNVLGLAIQPGREVSSNAGRLVITDRGCYQNANWIEIYARTIPRCAEGAEEQLEYEDVPEYHVCFDSDTVTTYYSRSFLIGLPGKNRPPGSKQPRFGMAKQIFGFDFESTYEQKNIIKTLEGVLGKDSFTRLFMGKKPGQIIADMKFSKGHLYPMSDAFGVYAKESTMYYINAPPQFNSVNNRNWEKMESALRDHAISAYQAMIVWTGTFGILKLPNDQGTLSEVYIEPKNDHAGRKLYVPKFFWKAIYNHFTGESIAIVQVNNPFTDPATEERLCPQQEPDLCDSFHWLSANFTREARERVSDGYLYCCTLEELRKTVPYAPYPEKDPDITPTA